VLSQSTGSMNDLLSPGKVIPVVENRNQLLMALKVAGGKMVMLRHCDLLDLAPMLQQAYQHGYALYVYTDHMEGVLPDSAGLRYLREHQHIVGVASANSKVLALGKSQGLSTILRIFAVDSTGLESSLESIDEQNTDMLDVSPALVVPAISAYLADRVSLPFIVSGLVSTRRQVRAALSAGAAGVVTAQADLWE
jgi:glycerol uptake operon antiterminator